MRKKWLSIPILIIVSSTLILGGCGNQAQKKPVTPKTNMTAPKTKTTTPNTVTRPAKKPVPTMSTSEMRRLADKLTNIAVTVKGVKSATVVVQPMGTKVSVLVGLTLDPSVKGKETTMIKNEITKKFKKADKRITRVLVTSNPDLVKRIEDIARGVIAGKPVQSFASEISELSRRIAPGMK
ncbi:MAG: YhcN/YlaJ family sporulation lipoprotein [Chitinophagales bacterium]